MESHALCYRCEYRALYLEEGTGPRAECKMTTATVGACYMFKPVKPIALERREGDERPMMAGILSSRMQKMECPELELEIKDYKTGIFLYWLPKKKRRSML